MAQRHRENSRCRARGRAASAQLTYPVGIWAQVGRSAPAEKQGVGVVMLIPDFKIPAPDFLRPHKPLVWLGFQTWRDLLSWALGPSIVQRRGGWGPLEPIPSSARGSQGPESAHSPPAPASCCPGPGHSRALCPPGPAASHMWPASPGPAAGSSPGGWRCRP